MKNKKVLVTGGCGFVGGEVVKQLMEKGYAVIVVDDFSNSTSLKESDQLRVINYDLTKSETLLEIFEGVRFCIHLAARVGGVKYMSSSQAEILRSNVLIDLNVISVASRTKTKIVYASTVMVYDRVKNPPFLETQLILPPESDYGFSKLVGERLCQSFCKDKNLKFTIARISNVYGINRNKIDKRKLHVIPDLVRKILQNNTLKIINEGKQRRTFIHVSDLARALILMMESEDANGEVFNVASKESYQILEISKMIWDLLKQKERFYFENIDLKEGDLIDSSADASKISRLLGWKAERILKKSLPEIVNWYQRV